MEYRKGTIPPSATRRGGPTPGPAYTPRDSGRGFGDHHSYSGHYPHGRGHHHGHSFFGFRFGFGSGFYGFYGYPYYYGPYSFYSPYYDYGLGYGYYPSYYPSYSRYRAESAEPQGGFDLNIKPKDTEVYLDGYFIGTVGDFDGWPRYLWLDEDEYELIFYKEGYETVVRDVSVQANVVVDLNFRMQPGPSTRPEELTRYKDEDPGYSSGRSRGDEERDRSYTGRSYGDREYGDREYGDREYGNREYGDREYDRGEGDRELPRRESRYADRGAEPESGRPGPGPGAGIDLRTEAGRLKLDVSPPEATVYIDGRFVGIGAMLSELDDGLLMDPGEHQIQVLYPQYKTEETTVTVTAGKDTRVGIALTPEK